MWGGVTHNWEGEESQKLHCPMNCTALLCLSLLSELPWWRPRLLFPDWCKTWSGRSHPAFLVPPTFSFVFHATWATQHTHRVTTDFFFLVLECIYYAASWEDLRGRWFLFGLVFLGSSHRVQNLPVNYSYSRTDRQTDTHIYLYIHLYPSIYLNIL